MSQHVANRLWYFLNHKRHGRKIKSGFKILEYLETESSDCSGIYYPLKRNHFEIPKKETGKLSFFFVV